MSPKALIRGTEMTNFAHVDYPTEHSGVIRAQNAAAAISHASKQQAERKTLSVGSANEQAGKFHVCGVAIDLGRIESDLGSWSCRLSEAFDIYFNFGLHLCNLPFAYAFELGIHAALGKGCEFVHHAGFFQFHRTIFDGQHGHIKLETLPGDSVENLTAWLGGRNITLKGGAAVKD